MLNLYLKEVNNKDELTKEFRDERNNWHLASWWNEYDVFIPAGGRVVKIKTEVEKDEFLKNGFYGESFYIVRRYYEDNREEEVSYYVVYLRGNLTSALEFLIETVIQEKIKKEV